MSVWTEQGVEDLASLQSALLKGSRNARMRPSPSSASSPSPASPSTLDDVRKLLGDCSRCRLSQGRKQIVFGQGNARAEICFVGEAPGAEEDAEGAPFVGPAGQLLSRILEAMGQKREAVYLTNTVKCHPSDNRVPAPDELESCLPFLELQLRLVRPKIIVALGGTAASALTGLTGAVGTLRGRFHPLAGRFKSLGDTPVMPTYHPAYLLKNAEAKRAVWEDMKLVVARLGKRA